MGKLVKKRRNKERARRAMGVHLSTFEAATQGVLVGPTGWVKYTLKRTGFGSYCRNRGPWRNNINKDSRRAKNT